MNKIYGVIFKDNCKIYYFKSDKIYEKNDYVIVETENGLQYAKIVIINKNDNNKEEFKEIVRKATDEDNEIFMKNLKDSKIALNKCRKLVDELKLNMNVINAQWTFERNQLVFTFTSDERVDFRELAKKLASIYHTRIELRQIGARDKAKSVGGIGICGRELCCKGFLNQMETISINMAKNQNLALNPSKINGVCGRLLCCLAYENDCYLNNLKGMPVVGDIIMTDKGEGKVISIDILNRKCQLLIGDIKEDYYIDENSIK